MAVSVRGLLLLGLLGVAAILLLSPDAHAQAVITNGPTGITLGVQATGQLSVSGGPGSTNCGASASTVSLLYNPTHDEAMDCDFEGEGWGATYAGGPVGLAYKTYSNTWTSATASVAQGCGSVNVGIGGVGSGGPPGGTALTSTFSSTATSATSTVVIGDLRTTQLYQPFGGSTPNVYKDDITLTNTNATATLNDVLYRRVMSWGSPQVSDDYTYETIDTLPTSGGFVPAEVIGTYLVQSTTCPDPTNPIAGPLASGPPPAGTVVYHWGNGPSASADQAMVWDFDFGSLAPGQSETFTLYYGGAPDPGAALATLGAIQAQIYDLSYPDDGLTSTVTFFMAFGNLPGPPPPPPPPPPPNDPPVLSVTGASPGPCNGLTWSFVATASDPGNDGAGGNAGSVVSLAWVFSDNPTPITGTPAAAAALSHTFPAPGAYTVTVTALDDGGLSTTANLSISTDADPYCCPALHPAGPFVTSEGGNLHFVPLVIDANGGPNTVTAQSLPVGATFGPAFDWTTRSGDRGSYTVSFTVRDSSPGMPTQCGNTIDVLLRVTAPTEQVPDRDRDGVADDQDNCPDDYNPIQLNDDGDALGDACDVRPTTSDDPPAPPSPSAEVIPDACADEACQAVDGPQGTASCSAVTAAAAGACRGSLHAGEGVECAACGSASPRSARGAPMAALVGGALVLVPLAAGVVAAVVVARRQRQR